ncbi:MAG TPA: helix-turn-helix domain-containing protein [bacterium]|nr:helix-turn-helix domain-containing protein [bacterium]HQJ66558.1 helix-turn-helix domain-containing protein [bacterium]
MLLFTVALSLDEQAPWQWGPTSLWLDMKFASDPAILKYTHVRASDSMVALMLGKTLILGSPPGKWVDPKHFEKNDKPARCSTMYEKRHVIEALCRFKGNQKKAADYLGVNRKTVWRWIRKYNLRKELP